MERASVSSSSRRSGVRAFAAIATFAVFASSGVAQAQGVFTGSSGGNEREVSLFDRSSGQVWKTVTGVSGRFRSTPLAAGEYLAISGSVFTPIRIEDGRATELLFSGQAVISADTETWSPALQNVA